MISAPPRTAKSRHGGDHRESNSPGSDSIKETNFLLWNTKKKAPDEIIALLVRELRVDVLLLIEHGGPASALVSLLSPSGPYHVISSLPRFHLLTRCASASIRHLEPFHKDQRSDYWHLTLPGQADILLVGVHGYDIKNYSPDAREMLFGRIAANIGEIEARITGHKRTVVFGDFNANPFDPAVGSLRGLHAVQMKAIAGKHHRTHAGRPHEFFYNPMWSRLGDDEGRRPPATFYYDKRQPHEIFWHMLDQVVLRPAALPLFVEQELRIISEVAGVNLLKRDGRPDPRIGSDHLPLFFRFDLRKASFHA